MRTARIRQALACQVGKCSLTPQYIMGLSIHRWLHGGACPLQHTRASCIMYRLLILLLLLPFSSATFAHEGMHMRSAQPEASPGQASALGAGATFDAHGRLWVVTVHGGHVLLRHSDDFGKTLNTPVQVNQHAENVFTGREVNPKVAIGPKGEIYVTWSEMVQANPPHWWDINVRFAHSSDGGQHFSKPVTVNDNHGRFTHSYDTLTVDRDGRVIVAWLDARDNKAARAQDKPYRGLTVYYTWSDDGGKTFVPNRKLADHSCECCRIALSSTPAGQVAAFFRMVYPGQIRDHAFALLRTDGKTDKPQRATFSNWRIEACPEHGPGLAIGEDGVRHAVWFEASHGPAIWYGQLDPGQPPQHKLEIGGAGASHADVAAHDGTVWVAWNQVTEQGYELMLRVSHDNGVSFGTPRSLATTSGAADSPRLLMDGGRAYIAWNTTDGFRLITARSAQTAALAPLSAADVPALLAPPAQGTRIIEFWALYCVYCEPNLAALADLQRSQPQRIQLVTVATDGIARHKAILARLQHMHMTAYPARVYASADPAHMNYRVAPNWGGALPFTVVIRADGSRIDYVGKLTAAQLKRIGSG